MSDIIVPSTKVVLDELNNTVSVTSDGDEDNHISIINIHGVALVNGQLKKIEIPNVYYSIITPYKDYDIISFVKNPVIPTGKVIKCDIHLEFSVLKFVVYYRVKQIIDFRVYQ